LFFNASIKDQIDHLFKPVYHLQLSLATAVSEISAKNFPVVYGTAFRGVLSSSQKYHSFIQLKYKDGNTGHARPLTHVTFK